MTQDTSHGARWWFGVLVIAIVFLAAAGPAAQEDGLEVYFSPGGGCEDAILQELRQAKRQIRIQAYYFTSARLAEALLRAHERDVDVRVILDSGQRTARYSSATFFLNQGIPVYINSRHSNAHDKIILIDDTTIITGSYNFTKSAEEKNSENLLILRGKARLMAAYTQHFDEHLAHSERHRRQE